MADMIPVDPTGINAAGKVALYFVPAIANPAAPKLAEIQAGLNLSKICYAWDPNGTQDKQERWRYGYNAAGTALGAMKYEPAGLEYDYDPQKPAESTGEYKHYPTLLPGASGFLVDRRGLAPDVAPAAGQIVDIYPCQLGERARIAVDPSQAGEKLRCRQMIAISGEPRMDVKIVG